MKTTTRLALFLAMTALSGPTFARQEATPTTSKAEPQVQRLEASRGMDVTTSHDATVDERCREPLSGADARVIDDARQERYAIAEYNHRRFLEQTWMAGP